MSPGSRHRTAGALAGSAAFVSCDLSACFATDEAGRIRRIAAANPRHCGKRKIGLDNIEVPLSLKFTFRQSLCLLHAFIGAAYAAAPLSVKLSSSSWLN